MTQPAINPLLKHFRQPAIQLRLPSTGQYWPAGSLDLPVNGELPVYPMTTKDEITIKTPDSLLNGASVVSVIQSCIPSIKDAWRMPGIDVDAALIAIRIASYGNAMEISVDCPHCDHKNEYNLDLHHIMSNVKSPDFSKVQEISGLKFKLKPQPYYSVNKVNMVRFEEQKMLQQLADTDISTEVRLETFRAGMQGLVELNLEILSDSTEYIQTDDNSVVNDYGFIREFYENCDASVTKQLQDTFKELNKDAGARNVAVVCANCTADFSTSLDFDYSSFFV
jgi:hypothetical protein